MFINLNLLFIVLIMLKKHPVNCQGSYEQGSYEEMDPDSREEQIYKSKPGEFTGKEEAGSNDPTSNEPNSAQASDNGSQAYDDQPQQSNHEKDRPPPPPDNSPYRNPPIINPYLTFNPFNLQPANNENPYDNQQAVFRQIPIMPLVPMQAQLFENYQLPYRGYQQPIHNSLLYQQMMYNLPAYANHPNQLRNLLANQQIITYEPIDDKTNEKDSYKGKSY